MTMPKPINEIKITGSLKNAFHKLMALSPYSVYGFSVLKSLVKQFDMDQSYESTIKTQ